MGIKYLSVEAKHPGALAWNCRAVESALDQARRSSAEQKVKCVAVSDGVMLYAANIEHGGLNDRVFVALSSADPPEMRWWLSVHGIYRPREHTDRALTSNGCRRPFKAILSNYRDAKVSSVPECGIPDVLVRLAREAAYLDRMPNQSNNSAAIYVQLEDVLRQLGRLNEVLDDKGV